MAQPFVVADTDLVIDFLRDRGPGAEAVRTWLRERTLRVSAITAFELSLGADFVAREREIHRLLGRRTLPLDATGALLAGDVFTSLRSKGRMIDRADALQAGICMRFDLPLATRNVRHFERIPGLRLVEV